MAHPHPPVLFNRSSGGAAGGQAVLFDGADHDLLRHGAAGGRSLEPRGPRSGRRVGGPAWYSGGPGAGAIGGGVEG